MNIRGGKKGGPEDKVQKTRGVLISLKKKQKRVLKIHNLRRETRKTSESSRPGRKNSENKRKSKNVVLIGTKGTAKREETTNARCREGERGDRSP